MAEYDGALAYGSGAYGSGPYIDSYSQIHETVAVDKTLIPQPPPVFTGMKLQADILLGDLVLNTIDENNVVWVCTDIEGWWSHPDPEVPDIIRGWGDGSYDASGRWAARQITLNGSFLTPGPEYVAAARDTLIRATSLVRSGAWLKTVENPTRAAFVRLSGRPDIATVNARGRTDFSIGLRAADPIKYSWNDSDPEGYDTVTVACANSSTGATGATTINNVGNTIVPLFIEVTGPIVAPATIANSATSELLTIVEPLRASETATVTFRSITSYVATLTLSAAHTIVEGDYVTITGINSTYNGEFLVVNANSDAGIYNISYVVTVATEANTASAGTVARAVDVLEIDTYTHEVALNGETIGARVKVDTLTDWLSLDAGNNAIQFTDEGDATSDASMVIYYRSGWIG